MVADVDVIVCVARAAASDDETVAAVLSLRGCGRSATCVSVQRDNFVMPCFSYPLSRIRFSLVQLNKNLISSFPVMNVRDPHCPTDSDNRFH